MNYLAPAEKRARKKEDRKTASNEGFSEWLRRWRLQQLMRRERGPLPIPSSMVPSSSSSSSPTTTTTSSRKGNASNATTVTGKTRASRVEPYIYQLPNGAFEVRMNRCVKAVFQSSTGSKSSYRKALSQARSYRDRIIQEKSVTAPPDSSAPQL